MDYKIYFYVYVLFLAFQVDDAPPPGWAFYKMDFGHPFGSCLVFSQVSVLGPM